MAKLILHVGPGKCGSSSIQEFFQTTQKPCVEKTHYIFLDPKLIKQLNTERPCTSLIQYFASLIEKSIIDCDALILSHEALFKFPLAVKHICSLASKITETTFIIGYSRRQSNFLVSAYSQWLFRSPDRLKETTEILTKMGIHPALFSGIERHLIACIENDFFSARQLSNHGILDWQNGYDEIANLVSNEVIVKCSVLPSQGSKVSLIEDFCQMAQLTLKRDMKQKAKVSNQSFHPDIIEAISQAALFGLNIPGPHENNEVIHLLSTDIDSKTAGSSAFLSTLKLYVDSYYLESNNKLCDKYSLDKTYFSVPQTFSKSEILTVITREAKQRSLNQLAIIENYQLLSAKMVELSIKLALKPYPETPNRENINTSPLATEKKLHNNHKSRKIITKLKKYFIKH